MPLQSKLPGVGTTIFTAMSKLAADQGAINLSQGYPDFDGPPQLLYEHIIFDDRPHESLVRYADLFERSFVVSSFGKTYHTTGWKVAYCIAPPPLLQGELCASR